ncbi:hypothetical protein ACP4OV_026631 [Aristida adscensionis]
MDLAPASLRNDVGEGMKPSLLPPPCALSLSPERPFLENKSHGEEAHGGGGAGQLGSGDLDGGRRSRSKRWGSRLGVPISRVKVTEQSSQPPCSASDRFNINSQLEHLQAKYVGTGHADLSRFEWAVNIQRDSYASYIGHYPMLAYFAIAENESIGRERYNFMQKMLLPCGLPPERDED